MTNDNEFMEVLKEVKDELLTKSQLDKYRDALVHLHTQFQLELAEVEKRGALFFDEKKKTDPEASDISIKRLWKASADGLREIELNRFIKAAAKEIDSLKSRLYSLY